MFRSGGDYRGFARPERLCHAGAGMLAGTQIPSDKSLWQALLTPYLPVVRMTGTEHADIGRAEPPEHIQTHSQPLVRNMLTSLLRERRVRTRCGKTGGKRRKR
jgi:hypothetical protein